MLETNHLCLVSLLFLIRLYKFYQTDPGHRKRGLWKYRLTSRPADYRITEGKFLPPAEKKSLQPAHFWRLVSLLWREHLIWFKMFKQLFRWRAWVSVLQLHRVETEVRGDVLWAHSLMGSGMEWGTWRVDIASSCLQEGEPQIDFLVLSLSFPPVLPLFSLLSSLRSSPRAKSPLLPFTQHNETAHPDPSSALQQRHLRHLLVNTGVFCSDSWRLPCGWGPWEW